jgi:periplasmic mercuric ion binding protein
LPRDGAGGPGGLNGVKKAEVSFEKKEAVVYFDEGRTNVEKMIEAVAKAGFRAEEKRSP